MTDKKKLTFIKYRNRKLHRTGDVNQYTTMEELLEIVASGVEVQVIDDQTQGDITAFTFARLVYDRCRMDRAAYSATALQKLIMTSPPPKKREKAA